MQSNRTIGVDVLNNLVLEIEQVGKIINQESSGKNSIDELASRMNPWMVAFVGGVTLSVTLACILTAKSDIPDNDKIGFILGVIPLGVLGTVPILYEESINADFKRCQPISSLSKSSLDKTETLLRKLHDSGELKDINLASPIELFLREVSSISDKFLTKLNRMQKLKNDLEELESTGDLSKMGLFKLPNISKTKEENEIRQPRPTFG